MHLRGKRCDWRGKYGKRVALAGKVGPLRYSHRRSQTPNEYASYLHAYAWFCYKLKFDFDEDPNKPSTRRSLRRHTRSLDTKFSLDASDIPCSQKRPPVKFLLYGETSMTWIRKCDSDLLILYLHHLLAFLGSRSRQGQFPRIEVSYTPKPQVFTSRDPSSASLQPGKHEVVRPWSANLEDDLNSLRMTYKIL